MLTKERKTSKAFIKAAIVLPIIGLLTMAMTFNQEAIALGKVGIYAEWWQPILKKHNVTEVKAYNHFENVFEMGDVNSMKDNVAVLTNATVIIRGDNDAYMLIQASYMEHDIKSEIVKVKSGTFKCYKMDTHVFQPLSNGEFKSATFSVKDVAKSTLSY